MAKPCENTVKWDPLVCVSFWGKAIPPRSHWTLDLLPWEKYKYMRDTKELNSAGCGEMALQRNTYQLGLMNVVATLAAVECSSSVLWHPYKVVFPSHPSNAHGGLSLSRSNTWECSMLTGTRRKNTNNRLPPCRQAFICSRSPMAIWSFHARCHFSRTWLKPPLLLPLPLYCFLGLAPEWPLTSVILYL